MTAGGKRAGAAIGITAGFPVMRGMGTYGVPAKRGSFVGVNLAFGSPFPFFAFFGSWPIRLEAIHENCKADIFDTQFLQMKSYLNDSGSFTVL